MYKRARVAATIALACARVGDAQSTAAYRAQLDSLAKVWRPMAAAESRNTAAGNAALPPIAFRVGTLTVRSDSASEAIAHTAAERLAPLIAHAYGESGSRLSRYLFIVRTAGSSAMAAVSDSSGRNMLRGSTYPTAAALYASWAERASEMFFESLDADLRSWMGGPIPLRRLNRTDWTDTRIRLLVEGSQATRECADGHAARCVESLGLSPVEHPLFTFYDAGERAMIVRDFAAILRRADPNKFDRCTDAHQTSACDSLADLIPSDAVSVPAPREVRQDFVRYVLEEGGEGALDRFLAPGTPRERVERVTRLPVAVVVARWQARFSDTRTTSTALDVTTAVSSLCWAAACAALALRSSRWR